MSAQFVAAHHHAGRIGRAHQQDAVELLLQMLGLDHGRGHGETICPRRLDRHRLDAESLENVAVGRIARRRDRDTRAGIEEGEERQREAA